MLTDGNILEDLATRDKTLFEKIKDWITGVIAKLRAAYKGMKPDSAAGRVMADVMTEMDELERLFADAVAEVGERRKTAGVGEDVQGEDRKVFSYIGETKDGRPCYVSGFDESVDMDERIKVFKERIATIFNLGAVELKTDVKKIRILGDRFTAQKNIYGDLKNNQKEQDAKISSLYDLADILATSTYDPNATDTEDSYANPAVKPKNKAHENVKYWYKFRNEIVFDGVPYTVTFNIRDKGKEQFQYLIDFKENKTPGLSNTAVKGLLRADRMSYDDSITQPEDSVNSKFSISEENSSESPDISGEGITVNMREQERAQILRKKTIRPPEIIVPENFDISREDLERNRKSAVEKPLIRKLREMGYLTEYQTNAIDVSFDFTAAGLRKSMNSQVSDYGGNLGDLAKVVMNMQALLDSSVLIEIHTDKGKGTSRENPQLVQTFVLMSAFREENTITPVQFEIKQFVDNDNRLYLAVALTKIETGVMGDTAFLEGRRTRLLPVSDISIPQFIEKINPRDEKFFKYIPDEFLKDEQKEAKQRAIAKDEAKYGVKYSVDDTTEAAESPDVSENETSRDLTDRELLGMALEGAVQNQEEYNIVKSYREQAATLELVREKRNGYSKEAAAWMMNYFPIQAGHSQRKINKKGSTAAVNSTLGPSEDSLPISTSDIIIADCFLIVKSMKRKKDSVK